MGREHCASKDSGTCKAANALSMFFSISSSTVNPVGPVFHLFSLGNPDFIIYMAELRPDEFGMNFQP